MAKGKYKARKDNRDANQLSADIAQAKGQLAQEQERLEQARADAGADAALRADLAAAIAARDAVCAPQITRITGDRTAIKTATRELDALRAALATHIEKIDEWALQSLGPEFYGAIVLGERFYFSKGVVSRNLDSRAVEDIQLAKGLRTHRSPAFSPEQQIRLVKISAAAAGREAPGDLTGAQDASWDAFVDSFVRDMASLLAFQSPCPWLDSNCDLDHPVSRVLGASITAPPITVSAANSIPSIAELSTATAALRDAVAAAGPLKAIDAVAPDLRHADYIAGKSQIATSLTASPPYPAPADAEALHTWYTLAALGAWGRHRNDTRGRIAVAAAAAVPFWLPPGHTIAYLDSEPLSGEDIDDMRLPFPNVMVTFAEPARLPASRLGALRADDRRLSFIDSALARPNAEHNAKQMIVAGTADLTQDLATVWEAIATRGAHIEGVLLLGDAHGHLDDLFGWCLAIPSPTSGTVLGRWVIPASRSMTSYANLVANAAAVACWADWHRPGQPRDSVGETEGLGPAPQRKSRTSEDAVHVLNVTATTAVDDIAAHGEPTGRTTAPHRRRGHWRRQRYGPGRAQVRRVRIAPVMVNAGRLGTERPQIYRLPPPSVADTPPA